MAENKDYWKELLGDDFDEELFSNVISHDTDSDTGDLPVESRRDDIPPEVEEDTEELPTDFDFAEDSTRTIPVSFPENQSYGGARYDRKDQGPDNFEVDFDFDREYGNPEAEKPVKKNKERRTGCLGGLLYFVFILCASVALAAIGWLAATDVLGLGDADEVVEVTIPDDYTVDQVTDILYSNDLIKYKSLFKLYSSFSHVDKKIDPGTYKLNKNYDYRALVYGMTQSSGKLVPITVTIPEGFTLKQVIELLDANDVCTADELWDAAATYNFDYDFLDASTLGEERRLEGYLFPDTYEFYVNDKPTRVLNKMLYNFSVKWTEQIQSEADNLGYTMDQILTIASIIEKEAGSGETERNDIACVIYNRLDDGMNLQMDSTINYIISYTGEAFSKEIDSPYNTHMYSGLPVGPICNPGMACIEAALNPSDESYYYFALGIDGTTHFFTSYDGFTSFINSDDFAD